MPVFLNIDGNWTEVANPIVKVNGSWVDLRKIMIKVSGKWMSIWDINIISGIYYIIQPTDNVQTINRAINSSDKPVTIVFGAGEWTINEPIIINRSNVTLQGVPRLTNLVRGFNSEEAYGMIEIVGEELNEIHDINIIGLTMDGQSAIYSGSAITGGNRRIDIEPDEPIESDEPIEPVNFLDLKLNDLNIEQCVFKNIKDYALGFYNVSNGKISSNYFYNIYCGIWFSLSNSVHIHDNHMFDGVMYVMYLYECSNFSIRKNTILSENVRLVIEIYGGNSHNISDNMMGLYEARSYSITAIWVELCDNNNIVGNFFNGINGYGMELISSNYNVISSNKFMEINDNGLYLEDSSNNSIIANTMEYVYKRGIMLTSSSNNNILASNIFKNVYNSTILDESDDNLMINNRQV